MKWRIKDNTIRVRFTQTEMDQLSAGERIESKLDFPGGRALTFAVAVDDIGEVQCDLDEAILVTLPQAQVEDWNQSDRVGLENTILLQSGGTLQILVEKDFKCLTVRPGEDESDMYPNPLTEHNSN